MKTKRLTLLIPKDDHRKLKGIASENETTMTDMVLEKIQEIFMENIKKGKFIK